MNITKQHVYKQPSPKFLGGSRIGTAEMTLTEAETLLGEPTERDIDGKAMAH